MLFADNKELFNDDFLRCVETNFDMIYGDKITQYDRIADAILYTSERDRHPNIGNDVVSSERFKFFFGNIFWINICLFANDEFREVIEDAIITEKMLLYVSSEDYAEARKNSRLDNIDRSGVELHPNIDKFSPLFAERITMLITDGRDDLIRSGMANAYDTLIGQIVAGDEPDSRCRSIAFIIEHVVYLINALSNNDVLYRYVARVIDAVKRNISQLPTNKLKQ